MVECSYGVVVTKYSDSFDIWLLFRSAESQLQHLEKQLCPDTLRIGDIVQANASGIRRSSLFPESVWTDGTRIVVRTIVSYRKEITIERGKLKDMKTDVEFVMLTSRDLGFVVAPTQWCNREFSDAGELHLFAYVEYLPRPFLNLQTDESCQFFWRLIGDRISLPVSLPWNEEAEKFVEPTELREVPALTMHRQGMSMLMWSSALGDRMAIISDPVNIAIGEWKIITVSPSSAREFAIHGCEYTVRSYKSAAPYTQPEFKVAEGKITMQLLINWCKSDSLSKGVTIWHDYYGLAIDYDNTQSDWINKEKGEFVKAHIEVSMIRHNVDGRRVSIKAVGPVIKKKVPLVFADYPHLSAANVRQKSSHQAEKDEKEMKVKDVQTNLVERKNEQKTGGVSNFNGSQEMRGGAAVLQKPLYVPALPEQTHTLPHGAHGQSHRMDQSGSSRPHETPFNRPDPIPLIVPPLSTLVAADESQWSLDPIKFTPPHETSVTDSGWHMSRLEDKSAVFDDFIEHSTPVESQTPPTWSDLCSMSSQSQDNRRYYVLRQEYSSDLSPLVVPSPQNVVSATESSELTTVVTTTSQRMDERREAEEPNQMHQSLLSPVPVVSELQYQCSYVKVEEKQSGNEMGQTVDPPVPASSTGTPSLLSSILSPADPPSEPPTPIRKSPVLLDRDLPPYSYFFSSQVEKCFSEQHKLLGAQLAVKEKEAEIIYAESLSDLFCGEAQIDPAFVQLLFGTNEQPNIDRLIDFLTTLANSEDKSETRLFDLLFVTGKRAILLNELKNRDASYDLYDVNVKGRLGPMTTYAYLLSNSDLEKSEGGVFTANLAMLLSMLATGQEPLVSSALISMSKCLGLPWDALLLSRFYYGADHEITRKVHKSWTEAVLMMDPENTFLMIKMARMFEIASNLKDVAYTLMSEMGSKTKGYELMVAYRCFAITHNQALNSSHLSELEKALEVAEASMLLLSIFVKLLVLGKTHWAKCTVVDLSQRASCRGSLVNIPSQIYQVGLTCVVELVEILLETQGMSADPSFTPSEAIFTKTAEKWRSEMNGGHGEMSKLKTKNPGSQEVVCTWILELADTLRRRLLEEHDLNTNMECVFLAVEFLPSMLRWAATARDGESLLLHWPERQISIKVMDESIAMPSNGETRLNGSVPTEQPTDSPYEDLMEMEPIENGDERPIEPDPVEMNKLFTGYYELPLSPSDHQIESIQQNDDSKMVDTQPQRKMDGDETEEEVQELVTSCGIPYKFSPMKNEAVDPVVASIREEQKRQQPVQQPDMNTLDSFLSIMDSSGGIGGEMHQEAFSAQQTSTVSSSMLNTHSDGSAVITKEEIDEHVELGDDEERCEHGGEETTREIGSSASHAVSEIAPTSLASSHREKAFNRSIVLALMLGVVMVVIGVILSPHFSDAFDHFRRQIFDQ